MTLLTYFTSIGWAISFCFCSSVDFYSGYFLGSKKSNIFSCIVFQCFFICNSISVLNQSELTKESAMLNLQYLYGYFLYDILNLFIYYKRDKNTLFIIHHVISIVLLRNVFIMELRNYHYPTILCLIAEIQNPIMNLKEFIVDYPTIKKYNKNLLFIMYFIFRIILFPIYAVLVIRESLPLNFNFNLVSLFFVLYLASLNWFLQMKNKFNITFY